MKGKFARVLPLVFLLTSIVTTLPAPAQIGSSELPRVIRYAGTLKDQNGAPRAGTVGMTFAIYAEQDSTVPLWQEIQNVAVDDSGHYSVLLGATRSEGLPAELFISNVARWLGIRVENEQEQTRILLAAVAYAIKAGDAETLGGKPLSAFVLNETTGGKPTAEGSTASGTATADAKTAHPMSINTTGSTGTQNQVAKWTDNAGTLGNSAITDTGSGVGVNTTSPLFPLSVVETDGSKGGLLVGTDATGNMFTIDSAVGGGLANLVGGAYWNGSGHVYGGTRGASRIWLDDGQMHLFVGGASGTAGNGVAWNELVTLSNSGNVGIRNANPQALLEVGIPGASSNQIRISGAGPNGIQFMNWDGSNAANVYFRTGLQNLQIENSAGAATPMMSFGIGSGNVGIGTNSPAQKLDVAGNINTSGNLTATGNVTATGTISGSNLSASGTATFTGAPSGTGVGNGALYVDPASVASGGYTLLGAAVGGSSKFLVDANGNITNTGTSNPNAVSLPTTSNDKTAGVVNLGGTSFLHNCCGGVNKDNTYLGAGAGTSATTSTNAYLAINNTGLGALSLAQNTTGTYNTAVGASSLMGLTTGSSNSALGYEAGNPGYNNNPVNYVSSGTNNTFVGAESGPTGSTQFDGGTAVGVSTRIAASEATAIGASAAANAANSTAMGYSAAANAANSTAVGYGATTGSSATNAVALGYGATTSTANAIALGGSSALVGVGVSAPGYPLDVGAAGRMRVRSGTNGDAGVFLYQGGTSSDRAFVGMNGNNSVGLYGVPAGKFGLTMDVTTGDVTAAGNLSVGSSVKFSDGTSQSTGGITKWSRTYSSSSCPSLGICAVSVSCTGTNPHVVGGGFQFDGTALASVWWYQITMLQSFPSSDSTWYTLSYNGSGTAVTFTAYAVCVSTP